MQGTGGCIALAHGDILLLDAARKLYSPVAGEPCSASRNTLGQCSENPMNVPAEYEVPADDRNLAAMAHLSGIFFMGFGALLIWTSGKKKSAFVTEQSKEALNFQITFIVILVVVLLSTPVCIVLVVLVPVLILPVFLVSLVAPMFLVGYCAFCVVAAIAASKGANYQYPLTLRLLK